MPSCTSLVRVFQSFVMRASGPKKNPETKGSGGMCIRVPFSGLFNVARNPVSKRHGRMDMPGRGKGQRGGEAAPCAVIWQTCQLHLAVAGHG